MSKSQYVRALGTPYGYQTVHLPGADGILWTADDVILPGAKSSYGNPFLFTEQRYDPEIGLLYYKNRYDSTSFGRFMTRDPMDYDPGPNLYEYVNDRPTAFADPLGLKLYSGSGQLSGMVSNMAYTPSYDWEIECHCNSNHEAQCGEPTIKNVKGLPISSGLGISAYGFSAGVSTSHSLELHVTRFLAHSCPVHPGDKETVGTWAEIDLSVIWTTTGGFSVGVAGVNSSGSAGVGSDTSQKSGSNTKKTHTVTIICCVCPPAASGSDSSGGSGSGGSSKGGSGTGGSGTGGSGTGGAGTGGVGIPGGSKPPREPNEPVHQPPHSFIDPTPSGRWWEKN